MQRLKPYENLNKIYIKSVLPWIMLTSILWAAAIVLSVIQIVFAHKYNFLFYLIFPVLFSAVWIMRRNTAKNSLAHFSDSGLARLNDEINNTEAVEGFGVTSEAMFASRNQLFALPINDIVWIYPKTYTGKILLIPVAKSYDMVVVDRNKKVYYLKGKLQNTDQAYILSFLECKLSRYRSGIFYGYTEELYALFCQDFNRMVYISDNS